jgi:hypothetical protein
VFAVVRHRRRSESLRALYPCSLASGGVVGVGCGGDSGSLRSRGGCSGGGTGLGFGGVSGGSSGSNAGCRNSVATLVPWFDLAESTLWARALGALASLTPCGVLAVVRQRRRRERLMPCRDGCRGCGPALEFGGGSGSSLGIGELGSQAVWSMNRCRVREGSGSSRGIGELESRAGLSMHRISGFGLILRLGKGFDFSLIALIIIIIVTKVKMLTMRVEIVAVAELITGFNCMQKGYMRNDLRSCKCMSIKF